VGAGVPAILDGLCCGRGRSTEGQANLILRVSRDAFFHLVTQFPQVGIEVMRGLATKLHRTTESLTAARAKLDELDNG
jgi:hypothetical protein